MATPSAWAERFAERQYAFQLPSVIARVGKPVKIDTTVPVLFRWAKSVIAARPWHPPTKEIRHLMMVHKDAVEVGDDRSLQHAAVIAAQIDALRGPWSSVSTGANRLVGGPYPGVIKPGEEDHPVHNLTVINARYARHRVWQSMTFGNRERPLVLWANTSPATGDGESLWVLPKHSQLQVTLRAKRQAYEVRWTMVGYAMEHTPDEE